MTRSAAPDATMKVDLEVLERAYEILQGIRQHSGDMEEDELLDPDSHLYFIDAFDMPVWHWSIERSTFDRLDAVVSYLRLV